MNVRILRPYETQEIKVAWLEVNTSVGNFVLQRGHAPMILVLSENKPLSYCLQSGKQERHIIPSGILKIDREHVIIVLNK